MISILPKRLLPGELAKVSGQIYYIMRKNEIFYHYIIYLIKIK